MKGIILAGGSGTRLRPVTSIINKHLLLVGRYPMIVHQLMKLKEARVTEIRIVTSKAAAGLFAELLGSGDEWGLKLSYSFQDEPGGIAHALQQTRDFIAPGESFIVTLGDNLFEDDLAPYIKAFEQRAEDAMVLLKEVHDPERFGVAEFDESDRIRRIIEKPEHPPSSLAVIGLYLYTSRVYDVIRTIRPSARGEMEITDVNNHYAAEGKLAHRMLDGWWLDAGTFESLAEASRLLQDAEY